MKILTAFVLFVCLMPAAFSQQPEAPITANEIMANVLFHDMQREARSAGYAGHRRYVLENERMHKRAELVTDVTCDASGAKHFNVVAEDGWKSANSHVLKKMLESESETSDPTVRPKTRLTAENYYFSLVSSEVIDGRPAYVIDVTPKRRDKYLMEGRVWIDAQDFALVRAEGRPARNPSFWTHSIHFVQQYRKSGSYWFPTSTLSVTEARLFGTTKVNIDYFDYTPNLRPESVASPETIAHLKEVAHVTN